MNCIVTKLQWNQRYQQLGTCWQQFTIQERHRSRGLSLSLHPPLPPHHSHPHDLGFPISSPCSVSAALRSIAEHSFLVGIVVANVVICVITILSGRVGDDEKSDGYYGYCWLEQFTLRSQ